MGLGGGGGVVSNVRKTNSVRERHSPRFFGLNGSCHGFWISKWCKGRAASQA